MRHTRSGVNSEIVLEVLDRLAERRITVWIDGGWGVDALVDRQTRAHSDLDLVIAQGDCPSAAAALADRGYAHDESAEPGLPSRIVLRDPAGHQVDLHPIVVDERGNGWQPLGGGAWGAYPAEGLTASGTIADREVRCLTPELQLRHHLGYPPDQNGRHDLRLLADHHGLSIPPDL